MTIYTPSDRQICPLLFTFFSLSLLGSLCDDNVWWCWCDCCFFASIVLSLYEMRIFLSHSKHDFCCARRGKNASREHLKKRFLLCSSVRFILRHIFFQFNQSIRFFRLVGPMRHIFAVLLQFVDSFFFVLLRSFPMANTVLYWSSI